jgi:hypothetical protein
VKVPNLWYVACAHYDNTSYFIGKNYANIENICCRSILMLVAIMKVSVYLLSHKLSVSSITGFSSFRGEGDFDS